MSHISLIDKYLVLSVGYLGILEFNDLIHHNCLWAKLFLGGSVHQVRPAQ